MSQEPEQQRAESDARGAELREELAITDLRRAEAQQDESKKERKRREAEERRTVAAEQARATAAAKADEARSRADTLSGPVSGAAVASPGRGANPKPAAAAAAPGGIPSGGTAATAQDKPELYVAAAFAGAFLFARILKKIAE